MCFLQQFAHHHPSTSVCLDVHSGVLMMCWLFFEHCRNIFDINPQSWNNYNHSNHMLKPLDHYSVSGLTRLAILIYVLQAFFVTACSGVVRCLGVAFNIAFNFKVTLFCTFPSPVLWSTACSQEYERITGFENEIASRDASNLTKQLSGCT